jgi:hypothetical protein
MIKLAAFQASGSAHMKLHLFAGIDFLLMNPAQLLF